MGRCKPNVLMVLLICIFNLNLCFAHEKIDTMCGVWSYIWGDGSYDSLAIEKISFTEYLIMYTSSYDHVHDMLEKGVVVAENLIYIKQSDDEEFFVYLDYDRDSVYFLWNHAIPDSYCDVADSSYDVELKRASEIFNDEYKQKKQQEFEEDLKRSVLEYLKQQK